MNRKDVHVCVDYETFMALKILMYKYEGNIQAFVSQFLIDLIKGDKLAKRAFNRYIRRKIRSEVDSHFKRYKIYTEIKDDVLQREEKQILTRPKEVEELYTSIEENYRGAIDDWCEEKEKKKAEEIQKKIEKKLKKQEEQAEKEFIDVRKEIKFIKKI